MPDKIILKIDASLMKSDSVCSMKTWLTLMEGWREPVGNNDTEFGSAFHCFVAETKRTGNEGAGIIAARNYYRRDMNIKYDKRYLTETHLVNVCASYWSEVGEKDEFETVICRDAECSKCRGKKVLQTFGAKIVNGVAHNVVVKEETCSRCNGTGIHDEPLVEIRFSIPYYEDDKVAVVLCGTIDDVSKHHRGTYAIRDYKTTSARDEEQFFRGFKLSPQLMFYRLAVRKYAEMYPNSIWAEINKVNVSTFIQGIFLRGKDVIEFHRSDMIDFTAEQMSQFEVMLHRDIMKIVALARGDLAPTKDGIVNGACGHFGMCKFANACMSNDPVVVQHVLTKNFTKKGYHPETWGE